MKNMNIDSEKLKQLLSKTNIELKNKEVLFKMIYDKLPEDKKIVKLIREKYSQDAEFAILRQRDTKPEEFAEYNAYCEECKAKVKNNK
jgi:hypothetical protein